MAKEVKGFFYGVAQPKAMRPFEWRFYVDEIKAKGGYTKRLAGDLIAFDSRGRIQFEIYDRVPA